MKLGGLQPPPVYWNVPPPHITDSLLFQYPILPLPYDTKIIQEVNQYLKDH